LKNIALNDEKSLVRAAAIAVLGKTFAGRDNAEIFSKAAVDKAPSVQRALNEVKKQL